MNALAASILCCGISVHHTTDHAPVGGYNETHESIGIHVEYGNEAWVPGIEEMYFKDSFDKPSHLATGTLLYRQQVYKRLHVAAGGGVGYAATSYYSGPYAAPLVEVGIDPVYVQASHQVGIEGADAVTAVQFKFRWEF